MLKTASLERIKCTPAERLAVETVAERDCIKMPEARRLLIRRGAQALGVWNDVLSQFRHSPAGDIELPKAECSEPVAEGAT